MSEPVLAEILEVILAFRNLERSQAGPERVSLREHVARLEMLIGGTLRPNNTQNAVI